jgi:putative flippase GtrA
MNRAPVYSDHQRRTRTRAESSATLVSFLRPRAVQPVRYALVGILNTLVDLAVLNLLFWMFSPGHSAGIAAINALSYGCGMVNSYLWNSRWTFASPQWRSANVMARFASVMVLAWAVNTATVVAAHAMLTPALSDSAAVNLAKLVATVASFVVGFLLCRWWVFKG